MFNDEFIGDNTNLTIVFDIVFLIPTYNRYDMLVSIIKEIETQCVNKKYKIIIFDDNSTDTHYSNLTENHQNIKYYKMNDEIFRMMNIPPINGKYYTSEDEANALLALIIYFMLLILAFFMI